jgi:hypothetical protein
MKKFAHILFIFSLFLTACSAPKIAMLEPNIPSQYLDREGFTTQKSDSLDVTFGYLFSTKDHLVFEVAVKNNAADSVVIDAQNFAYQDASYGDSTQTSAPVFAHSFNQIINQWNERTRQKNLKTVAVVLGVVATLIVLDEVINTNSNSHARYTDYSLARSVGFDFSYNIFDAMIYNHLSKKEAKKQLEKSYLFPQKIGKFESHIGAVYFPRNDNARQLLFNFKVGDKDFKTAFRQSIKIR